MTPEKQPKLKFLHDRVKEAVVLTAAQVCLNQIYELSVLPCGIYFEYRGQYFQTITHPVYNLAAMNLVSHPRRTVMNVSTQKTEEVPMSASVTVVKCYESTTC